MRVVSKTLTPLLVSYVRTRVVWEVIFQSPVLAYTRDWNNEKGSPGARKNKKSSLPRKPDQRSLEDLPDSGRGLLSVEPSMVSRGNLLLSTSY